MTPKPEATPYLLSGRGVIYSHTTVYDPPKDFESPYTDAIISLAEGTRITARLTEVDRAITGPDGHVYLSFQPGIPDEVLATGVRSLVDSYGDPVDIGTPVEMVTRKIKQDGERGYVYYGYMFRPCLRRTV